MSVTFLLVSAYCAIAVLMARRLNRVTQGGDGLQRLLRDIVKVQTSRAVTSTLILGQGFARLLGLSLGRAHRHSLLRRVHTLLGKLDSRRSRAGIGRDSRLADGDFDKEGFRVSPVRP